MRRLAILVIAALLAGCGPSQADVDAASAEQRQAARADSLEAVAAAAQTATEPAHAAPTAVDSLGIVELERNAHLERMIDSAQSSLGL